MGLGTEQVAHRGAEHVASRDSRGRRGSCGRRGVFLLLMAVLLPAWGCASGGSGGREDATPTPAQVRSVVRIDGYAPVEIFNEPGVGVRTIATEVGTAWRVLGGVYEQMGIPVTESDPRAMQLGNPAYLARRVDGDRMNSFIDCGSDFSGPLANQYDITLTVITKLTSKGPESTEVLTMTDAYGKPRAVSGNSIHCTSRGVLEMRIAQKVADALQTGPE